MKKEGTLPSFYANIYRESGRFVIYFYIMDTFTAFTSTFPVLYCYIRNLALFKQEYVDAFVVSDFSKF